MSQKPSVRHHPFPGPLHSWDSLECEVYSLQAIVQGPESHMHSLRHPGYLPCVRSLPPHVSHLPQTLDPHRGYHWSHKALPAQQSSWHTEDMCPPSSLTLSSHLLGVSVLCFPILEHSLPLKSDLFFIFNSGSLSYGDKVPATHKEEAAVLGVLLKHPRAIL